MMKDRHTSSSLTGPCNGQYGTSAQEQSAYNDKVSVSNPTAQAFIDTLELHPVPQLAIYKAMFEYWASKNYRYEKQGSCAVEEGDGPQTK